MKIPGLLSKFLLLLLASASSAAAQVKIGAFGDLNRASLSGDAPKDYSYSGRSAIGFGLIGEFHVGNDVWISVQPMIAPRGTGIEFKVDDEQDPIKVAELDLSYFALPVMAKFVTTGGKVYITSGVNVSFLTGADFTFEGSDEAFDLKDSFEDIDLAVDFGVGGQLPLGPIEIMLEARYEQGILNVANEDPSEESLKTRLRSSGLQLIAGILLTLGGDR